MVILRKTMLQMDGRRNNIFTEIFTVTQTGITAS